MYCQDSVNKSISEIQPRYQYNGNVFNFELQDYSYKEIQQIIENINNYIDIDLYEETKTNSGSKCKIELKDKNKQLPRDAFQFISNEKIRCQIDANHFLENYYKISDVTNTFRQYKPTKPQQVWKHILSNLQKQGRAIRLLIGKARQTTSTTHAQGQLLHRTIFIPDTKAMIASYEENSSRLMSGMYTDALFRLPWWLKPRLKSYETGNYYSFENNSYMDISYGTRRTLATGTTPTVSLCSEISKYKYPKESIEASLIRAMHETEWLFQLFESTADGNDDDNYFKQKWYETIKGMENGTSSLYASFIPWPLRDDIYPTKEWILGRQKAFNNYKPSLEVIMYAKKIENYVRTNPDLVKIVGSNWSMPIEQLFYYEISYKENEERGELWLFLQEMPGTPEEMFQNSGKSIYPMNVITHYNSQCYEILPEVYKIKGDNSLIPQELWPDVSEIKPNGKIIPIRAKHSNYPSNDYQLIEVKFEGWDRFDYKNKILIWEHPKHNSKYGMGNDNSDGLGEGASDDAVLEIVKAGTIKDKDKQVCEFASPDLNPTRLWPIMEALASYYSLDEQILIAVELNNGGSEAQTRLLERGFGNFYRQKDDTKLGEDVTNFKNFGFKTTPRTRPLLQNHIHNFLIGKYIDIYSLKFLEEIKGLKKVRSLNNNYTEGGKILGAKDNRFLALSIILYCLHEDGILGYQKADWVERLREEKNIIEFKQMPKYLEGDSRKFDLDDYISNNSKPNDFDYDKDEEFSFEVEML
jgi:hypothetical protein